MKPFVLMLMLVALAPASFAAEGLHPDADLLSVKGYSGEVIYHTGRQSLRQEWKPQETPYRSKWQQLRRNLWRNDWTGALDEFGSPSLSE
jgi:hypothetical protein